MSVLKQLLNPTIYSKLMGPAFDKHTQNIEQREPDRDDY